METLSSSRPMRSLPVSQAGSHAEGDLSLLQTFQAHIEDMRNLVLCKICIRPLYEPYTLGCGHTYCYSCLTSWFDGALNRRERKNCPDCRASVVVQPSPNYLLRDLVHMFISRVELLPEDETTAEHDEAKLIEAQRIETDRTARTDGEPSLFKGAFRTSQLRFHGPIRDEEDGVLRCPMCAWEMEDGECGQCGYADDDGAFSDGEDHEGDTIDSRSVISITSSTMDADAEAGDYAHLRPLLRAHNNAMQEDFREWMRRDEANRRARRARRVTRENRRRSRQERASATDAYNTDSTMEGGHHDRSDYGADSENEEMAAFPDQSSHNRHRWNDDAAETVDEDEEMTSAMDEEDVESTTSFHRAAILARDRGMNPPFESDLSTDDSEGDGDGDTVTNASNDSEESTESDDDNDTPEPTPAVHRLASRPARVVIDTDDEDSDSDNSSGNGEEPHANNDDDDDDDSDDDDEESNDDSTPSPPRPTAVRQARVQMHRGRRGGNGRGRPRTRN